MITKFKSIRKKSDILNAGHGLIQCSPLLTEHEKANLS